jgi:uncharacterized membrane protein
MDAVRWLLLGAFLLVGLGLRTANTDWDHGRLLHPDERYWTFVTAEISGPSGIGEYLDSESSRLNPYSTRPSWVYGTVPLFLNKAVASWLEDGVVNDTFPANVVARAPGLIGVDLVEDGLPVFDDGSRSHVVGRLLSALFETATIALVFAIGRRLFGSEVGLLAAAIQATVALHIQHSHFYGAETIAAFFVALVALGALSLASGDRRIKTAVLTGIALGLAVASKVNSVGAVAMVMVASVVGAGVFDRDQPRSEQSRSGQRRRLWWAAETTMIAGLASLVVFRLTQPYAFSGGLSLRLDTRWIADLERLAELQAGVDFPPGVQWIGRAPVAYPIAQMFRWGMGPLLTIAAATGVVLACRELWARRMTVLLVPLSMVAAMVVVVASRRTPVIRYLLPAYPFLAVFAAWAIVWMWRTRTGGVRRVVARSTAGVLLVGGMGWGLAFAFGVYGQEHPRIEASLWMAQNIPIESVVSTQHWDDSMPQRVAEISWYTPQTEQLTPFHDDSPEETEILIESLLRIDYVVESSNRVYDSVSRVPARYPITNRYYDALFSGDLGFDQVAQFRTSPALFGISVADHNAEEAFTVYDHPTVTIWEKGPDVTRESLTEALRPDLSRKAIYVIPGDSDTNALQLRPAQYAQVQTSGGAGSIESRSWTLGPDWLWWLLWLELAALAVLPWVTGLMSGLSDQGFAASKLLGLGAVGLPVWAASAWLGLQVDTTLVLGSATLVAGAGAVAGIWRREHLVESWRTHRHAWLRVEMLFLSVFAAALGLRAIGPDLDIVPGRIDQFGEFAAAVGSPSAIVPDPGYSGGYLNLGTLGWGLLVPPIRALGLPPAVAWNLAIATYVALIAALVFVLTFAVADRIPGLSKRGVVGAATAAVGIAVVAGPLTALGGDNGWLDPIVGRAGLATAPIMATLTGDLAPHVMALPWVLLVVMVLVVVAWTGEAERWLSPWMVAAIGGLLSGVARAVSPGSTLLTFVLVGSVLVVLTVRQGRSGFESMLRAGGYGVVAVAAHLVPLWPVFAAIEEGARREPEAFMSELWLQLWILVAVTLPVSAAAALKSSRPKRRTVVSVAAASLIAVLLYPAVAMSRVAGDRVGAVGLDALAFLDAEPESDPRTSVARMAGWFEQNVVGFPTVLQGPVPETDLVSVSDLTGLPAVLGSLDSQRRMRANYLTALQRRSDDVEAFWQTTDSRQLAQILRTYDVSYVVVGPLERDITSLETLTALARLDGVEVARAFGDDRIYRVDQEVLTRASSLSTPG